METTIPIKVTSRIIITEDDNVIRDVTNAIHPQNLARIFARGLSGEFNSAIYRMAFGNGGTTTDAAMQVVYRSPNTGSLPDIETWGSRLYHETYSEICYSQPGIINPLLGTDPGSADTNTGIRPGGGAVPEDDPAPNSVVSTEYGLMSEVTVTVTVNGNEPNQQLQSDQPSASSDDFIFDEIGLYTAGARATPTSGYQQIEVGNRNSTDSTGLVAGRTYLFDISVDGGTSQTISFKCPSAGGSGPNSEILYGDLCQALNTGDPRWSISPAAPLASVSITDTSDSFPTISGAQTYGYLMFTSPTTGLNSKISLAGNSTSAFLNAINPPLGGTLLAAVNGTPPGVANDRLHPNLERERLLTHLIFAPVTKVKGRTLVVTYKLSITVAPTTK